MRRSLLVVPFLAMQLAGCSKATTTAAAAAPKGPVMPAGVTMANITMGDSIFNTAGAPCQRCHGQKGVGGQNGPSLVAGPWLQSTGKYEEIVATITNGVPRTALKDQTRRFPMNPRGGPMNLNDDQVKAVAAYVYSISRDRK
jgi:mono/diheme cytochrome c family protein